MKPLSVFDIDYKGFNLVEASAGTGKTYNITSLYVRAIVEKGWMPNQILTLTYTEDATAELRQRVRSRIEESIYAIENDEDSEDEFLKALQHYPKQKSLERLRSALFSFDEAVISTIHGFCQKLLREYSIDFEVQADFEILNDQTEVIQEAVDNYWRKLVKEYSKDPLQRGILNFLMNSKVHPENLKDLMSDLLGKPYAMIQPSSPSHSEIKTQTDQIKNLFLSLQHQWEKDKGSVLEIFHSGKMNKGIYKPEKFQSWMMELEYFLQPDTIELKPFKDIEKFSEQYIETKSTKDYEPTIPKFCVLLDEFLELVEDLEFIWVSELHKAISGIKEEYREIKSQGNALSFDDLLQITEHNLSPEISGKISKQFPLALVDEFQDTDPVQYSIFRKLFYESESALFMIGDPKQAIYSFRGADLFTYFKATDDIKEEKKFSLETNYRSSRTMIEAVNQIFNSADEPFIFDQPKFRPVQFPHSEEKEAFKLNGELISPLRFVECDAEGNNKPHYKDRIIDYVARQIQQLLNKPYQIGESAIMESDIAILVRRRSWINPIQNALSNLGIKSSIKSKESVFQTEVSEELLLMMRCLKNNSDSDLIRAGLVSSMIGYKSTDLKALSDDSEKWGEILKLFRDSFTMWIDSGFTKAFQNLNSYFGIREKFASFHNSERLLTDLDHLLELLSKREQDRHLVPGALIRFHKKKLEEDSTTSDEDKIRLESEGNQVTITTLHSSKGLEYPITFLPDLWENFESIQYAKLNFTEYHDTDNNLCIDLRNKPSSEIKLASKKEKLADALRLTYVALTRSKYACFIPFGDHSDIHKSSLKALISGHNQVIEGKKEGYDELISNLNDFSNTNSVFFGQPEQNIGLSSTLVERERDVDTELVRELAVLKNERNDLYAFPEIVSYSSLSSSGSDSAGKASDEFDWSASTEYSSTNEVEISKHTFPKGKETGNLLHNIFEHIDFNNSENHSEIIEKELKRAGFKSDHHSFLINWVNESLDIPLTENIRLNSLKEEDVLKEMEFHFPVKDIDAQSISKIIRGEEAATQGSHYKDKVSGFMKGFIDLIFRNNGKYYILDYKSNYLGESDESYSQENLQAAMTSSGYDIQYHIYSVALKKFLESRKPDVDFESVFGGVIYLFLRGVNKEKPGSGIFFDKPGKSKISTLEKLMEELDNE